MKQLSKVHVECIVYPWISPELHLVIVRKIERIRIFGAARHDNNWNAVLSGHCVHCALDTSPGNIQESAHPVGVLHTICLRTLMERRECCR